MVKVPLLKHQTLLVIIISVIFVNFLYPNIISDFFIRLPFTPKPEMTELPSDIKESVSQSIPNVMPQRVPIFLYHYVEYVKDPNDTIRKSLNINPAVFENQLKTLKDAGYKFITPAEITGLFVNNQQSEKVVILSFDDGYRGFYTDVFPLLKKYQAKAIVYVIPGFINKPNNLTDWQLKEISQSSLVEIGSHTVNHIYLKGLSEKQAESEIRKSKEVVEELIGVPVVSFAYPWGAFDSTTIRLLKEAGYSNAVSLIPGVYASPENLFYLSRIRPGIRVKDELLQYLQKASFTSY